MGYRIAGVTWCEMDDRAHALANDNRVEDAWALRGFADTLFEEPPVTEPEEYAEDYQAGEDLAFAFRKGERDEAIAFLRDVGIEVKS